MTTFTLPTSRPITQPWGAEFDDWDGDGVTDYPGGFYHSIGWDGHNGIDYGCQVGDPIEAVADGVAAFAAWAGNHWLLSGGGNAILIEHAEHGVQTEYLHLSEFAVTAGQKVTKGQVIGYAGKTGSATAPHLHLGMLPLEGIDVNNRMRGRIDPTPYLYGGLAAMGIITQEDDVLTIEDKEWLGNKLYEVAQDKELLEKQRAAYINDETLRNIQGTILPSLNAHVQNLWDGIQAVPGLVVTPDLTAAFDKLKQEISNIKVTVSLEGK